MCQNPGGFITILLLTVGQGEEGPSQDLCFAQRGPVTELSSVAA